MQKIRLEISGIAYSQTQSGSYVLTLSEAAGKRKLPIVIGGFEAQAIAVELEKMIPNRPLTHDLIKSFCITYDVIIKEVLIYKFVEGVFYLNASRFLVLSLSRCPVLSFSRVLVLSFSRFLVL